MTPLLDTTLDWLDGHRATRGIRAGLARPDYDRAFGERVCRLVERLCSRRGIAYEAALRDFVVGCEESLRHQRLLERTGRYACESHADAERAIYRDDAAMATYLHTLLLSQALWPNHARMFAFFRDRFCAVLPPVGRVLEVPVGTGLFVAELARMRPEWAAVGIDLSPAAIELARHLVALEAATSVELRVGDVFALAAERPYDRVICGELLEHVDRPHELLAALARLVAPGGRAFLTTAVWAAHPDHVYLFRSVAEVRALLRDHFAIEDECALPLEPDRSADDARIPINYGCVLAR